MAAVDHRHADQKRCNYGCYRSLHCAEFRNDINSISGSGQDSDGNQLPVETYQITASAVVDGRMQIAPVSILETVSSVSWNPAGQQLDLQLLGGDTVSLAEIQTIAE